jgi:hypothetical protein
MSQHAADCPFGGQTTPKHHVHTVGCIGFEHKAKNSRFARQTVHFWPLLSAAANLSVRRSVSPQQNVIEVPGVHFWIRRNLINNKC